MSHVLIYLKIMTKVMSKIVVFPRKGINIVYKKNIKFGKKLKF